MNAKRPLQQLEADNQQSAREVRAQRRDVAPDIRTEDGSSRAISERNVVTSRAISMRTVDDSRAISAQSIDTSRATSTMNADISVVSRRSNRSTAVVNTSPVHSARVDASAVMSSCVPSCPSRSTSAGGICAPAIATRPSHPTRPPTTDVPIVVVRTSWVERCPRRRQATRSASQRVWPQLELDDLSLRALAAFDVPHEVRSVIGVERAAFPAARSDRRCGRRDRASRSRADMARAGWSTDASADRARAAHPSSNRSRSACSPQARGCCAGPPSCNSGSRRGCPSPSASGRRSDRASTLPAHSLPSTLRGPVIGLHLRRSKLARWLLAASAVHTTPLVSMSTPRGSKPGSGTCKSPPCTTAADCCRGPPARDTRGTVRRRPRSNCPPGSGSPHRG